MGHEVLSRVFSVLIHFGALKNAKYGLNGLNLGSFGKINNTWRGGPRGQIRSCQKGGGWEFFHPKSKIWTSR